MPTPNYFRVPAGAPDTASVSRLALEHYDPRPIRNVPIERWRDVVSRCGAPPGLPDLPRATIDDVVTALTQGSLRPLLRDLLQTLHDLGNAKGSHVLNEAAAVLGIDRTGWPDAV